jgi:hypothetical protein
MLLAPPAPAPITPETPVPSRDADRRLPVPLRRAASRAALLALWSVASACTDGDAPRPAELAAHADRIAGRSVRPLPAQPIEVTLTPWFRALYTVPLTSGDDSLSFLLDTGGGYTLLSLEGARRLGCRPDGRTVAHRMDGEPVTFQWCHDVPLALGGVPLDPERVAVLDLAALLPPDLPRLDGLLSLQSFAGRVVSLDLVEARLILESAESLARRRARARRLNARTATGYDGAARTVLLAARRDPDPLWLLLDSGNLIGTVLAPHAARALGAETAAVGDSVVVALEVLGLAPRREPIRVRDLIYDGVLGAAFLQQGRFTVDLRGVDPWVGVELVRPASAPETAR